jgi:ribosomal protein S12 methylthiotransferase
MAAHDNICSYLDIPFQQVNERILKAMNRTGSRASYEALIAHVRDMVPGITLRTTFIAGFPTETDDEFQEACDFIEDADLDYIGVFPYSQEEGTLAGRMEGQIDEDTKEERARDLRAIADSISRVRVADRIGQTMEVLVLGREEDGQLYGRAQCQAPDVDGVTYVHKGAPGDIVTVTITDTLLYEMEGE